MPPDCRPLSVSSGVKPRREGAVEAHFAMVRHIRVDIDREETTQLARDDHIAIMIDRDFGDVDSGGIEDFVSGFYWFP